MSNIFPSELLAQLCEQTNFDKDAFLYAHQESSPPVSIRINPGKNYVPDKTWKQVSWCGDGYYLPKRPSFTLDPMLHAGCYYVQEASSMFIAHAAASAGLSDKPQMVLDLCAAPGGKSTLLNSVMHPDSLLVANEIIKTRVTVLADNLTRWGNMNTIVTHNDPSAFGRLAGYFDVMLVDAPCSGSGLFRKDNKAIQEWSENVVNLCSQRQRRILSDSLSCLKEGGILMYSTCSYSDAENETIADWLISTQSMENIRIPILPEWQIEETLSDKHRAYGYRFYPHRVKGEGFFISVFRKQAAQKPFESRKLKKQPVRSPSFPYKAWISTSSDLYSLLVDDELLVIPEIHAAALQELRQALYIKKAGTKLGKLIGQELIPNHELALSNFLHPDVGRLELTKEDALDYLRKKDIRPAGGTSGWVLMSHLGHGLGWAKILPNRVNNYYPKEWRIIHL